MAKTTNIKEEKIQKVEKVNKDSPGRSIFKAISWRIIASLTTFFVARLIFKDDPHVNEKAGGVALIESALKIVLYYGHERAWTNIKWGKYWMKYGLIRRIKLNHIKYKRKRKFR